MKDAAATDDELLLRLRRGDREAFAELARRWQGPLWRYFVLTGRSSHDAEDLVQETFIRVYGYRKRYRPSPAGFRAFLFRLARNAAADDSRRRSAARRSPPEADGSAAEPLAPDPATGWNDALDVRRAVLALPGRLREVIVLHAHEGLTYREIARVLDVPLGTVKSRMHHALRRLREVLHADLDA